jgi:hypothetical protein
MSDAPQKPKWAKRGPSPNPGGRKKAPQPGVAQPVSTFVPAERMCAVIDDGSEDIEARIARCRAETGLSGRDVVVIVKRFCELAPGKAPEPPWTMRPLVG